MGLCESAPPPATIESDEDEPSGVMQIPQLSSLDTINVLSGREGASGSGSGGGGGGAGGGSELSFHPSAFLSSSEFDLLFKVLLIGESGVGKSSILLRFADDSFRDNQAVTIGVDFKIRTINIDGKRVKLQIWDTAGQERFRTVARAYFRGTHGVILCYDITNRRSFDELSHWFEQLASHAPSNCIKLIVGNKLDRSTERMVSSEEASEYAREHSVLFLETSAKDNTNILEAFETLAREIKNRISAAGTSSRFSTGR